MTRAYTLADVIGQLNNDSSENIDLSPTEIINEYFTDRENAVGTESWVLPTTPLLAPYDLSILQDAGPVAYWRLNEYANILTAADAGFESGTTGSYTATAATIANSTTQHHSGTHSLQVSPTGANSGAFTGFYGLAAGGVKPGGNPGSAVYAGGVWVFSTVASKTFTVTVTWFDLNGVSTITFASSPTVTPALNTWTYVPFSFQAPARTGVSFTLKVVCTNSASGNTWFMDDVFITQVGYDSMPFSPPASAGYAKAIMNVTAGTPQPGTQGPYQYPGGGGIAGPSGNGAVGGATTFLTVGDKLGYNNGGFPSNLVITGDLSIEMWINANAALSGSSANIYGMLADNNGVGGLYCLSLRGDGAIMFAQQSLTEAVVANAGSIPNTNTWHHVVLTRQFGIRTIKCYVDSVLKNSISYTSSPTQSPLEVDIGANSSHNTLVGLQMSEVALYGRALTQTQVTNHYQWAGYGSPPAGQTVTGSGYGNSYAAFTAGWSIPKVAYGQYGFTQYPNAPASSSAQYDSGAVWGVFVWG